MTNPNILVVGEKISNVAQLIPILEPMVQSGRPFIIICDDMDEVVLSTLVLNTLQGACRCCVLKGIEFGENRGPVMQDIATATGATYITPEIGLSVTDATTEMLGSAKKVIIGKYTSIIFEGCGDEEEINERIETIKARLEDKNLNKYDRGRWEKRLANLSGGIGVIHAGGASEVERVNKKATVEDAILALKKAIDIESSGVVIPDKNGENYLTDDPDNEFIKLIANTYKLDPASLVAIYSVPDSGTNYVLRFKKSLIGNKYEKSVDNLYYVYHIGIAPERKISYTNGQLVLGDHYNCEAAEGVMVFNLVQTMVMDQYPDYFEGTGKTEK
jgi:hypothetical protein